MGEKAEVLEGVLKETVDLVPDLNFFRCKLCWLGFCFPVF